MPTGQVRRLPQNSLTPTSRLKHSSVRLVVAWEESSPKAVTPVDKILVCLLCGADGDMDNARRADVVIVQGVADVFIIRVRLNLAAVFIPSLFISFNSTMRMSEPSLLQPGNMGERWRKGME